MLDDRSKTLLKTLIERYIADGQPVGSRALSRLSGLDLSAATVRNVMADLEELGYIASPHTSAGRVPTPRGYRFFVDSLLTMRPLEAEKIHAIEGQLRPSQPQPLISSASHLLSGLTHFAGIVLSPRRKTPKIRQIEFVSLSEKRILLIIVTTDGDVQNRVIVSETDFTQSQLTEAANYLNAHYAGMAIEMVRERLRTEVQSLAAPDDARLAELKAQLEAGEEDQAVLEARLGELSEAVPALDEARKAAQADEMFSSLVAHMNHARDIAAHRKYDKRAELPTWLTTSTA